MSKEAYYFSHDANARHDPKILAMRSEYGITGYGVYWIIIEMLREQENFKLPMKKYVFNAIAMQVQCKDYAKDDAKSFVENCINEYELFASDGDFFWSNSLLKRMEKKNDLSEKRREAARKRWAKDSNDNETDANAMQNDANAMQTDARKGKESKRKESKTTTTTTEKAGPNPFDFYQQNFGVLSPYMGEEIGQWSDDLNDELVIEAMKITLKAGKKWNYAAGILKDWYKNNVKTVDDAKALDKSNGKQGDKWEGLE
jgi:DnaD/phage-associated family protein